MLFFVTPASASVTFDHSVTASPSVASSYTIGFTVSGTAPSLLLSFSVDRQSYGATVTSVTYNSVAMTAVNNSLRSSQVQTYLYQLNNPTAGTHNIAITFSGSIEMIAIASEWLGTTTITNSNTNNGASGSTAQAITTAGTNSVVFSTAGTISALLTGATQTEDDHIYSGAYRLAIQHQNATSPGSYTQGWTSTADYAQVTAELPVGVLGCTDPVALNYDSSANIDDGSCTYPSSLMTSSVTGGTTTYVLTVSGENYLTGLATSVAGSFPLTHDETWYVLNAFAAILIFGLGLIAFLWGMWFFYWKARY